MNKIKRVINGIKKRIILMMKFLLYKMKYGKNAMYIRGAVIFKNGKLKKNNWGDDLNIFLVEQIFLKKVIPLDVDKLFLRALRNVYLCIGSVLTWYDLDGKIIIGTGVMDPKATIRGCPSKIISVRGPKTRNVLMANGIQCPKVYGDLALLLPLYYEPKRPSNKNKVVIIPNNGTCISTIDRQIELLSVKYDIEVVNMTCYDNWTDVIDAIVNARCVISESLHGLIVAEAYGIPCVWVEFVEHPQYWGFKFEDFYESIGRTNEFSVKLYNDLDDALIIEKLKGWKRKELDFTGMLQTVKSQVV